ncbi:MAG: hypothetical protein KIC55_07980 [Lachnoanaerobaculum sp.]|uniref:hypothetical protein n=1 Tax=Lachnoanaerobaculum sp. TaxID=2049030 RepID=UPI0025BA97D4|nr:hypothetical protein [Lachnoanaerobaculum sp.]MBS5882319.1 hypothetical protein [Lachnoanaerobaculum sp.]
MADAILMAGGTGGVTSDDVTAGKAHVLKGYKTVTTESNDEIVEGEMVNRGNIVDTVGFENAHWDSKFLARMEQGFYAQNEQWKPCVAIPYAVLANGIGVDANKMLDSLTLAGVRGTIPIRGYHGPDSGEMWLYPQEGGYVVRIEEGYYHMGGNRQWKPYVIVPTALAKSAVNYHPEATLNNTTTCGEQGQIKMINTQDNGYTVNQAKFFALDPPREKLVMGLGHGNAYYHRNDNNPHVEVDASVLGTAGADSVLQWQTASSQSGIKFEGSIPRWVCNTGDVISAVNNSGFAWDDATGANRGRGIVTKIPNGHYIQGANYVFLPSPNLYPWNIREGVNIHGIVGTMKDSNAGRVAFRNATFDGVLISGVANIGLGNNLNSYSVPSTEIIDGIIRFNNGVTTTGGGLHEYYADRRQMESITLAHSVNLSPFRTIRLGLKFPYGGQWGTREGNGHLVGILWTLPTNITPNYNFSRNSKIHPNIIKRLGYNRNIIPRYWGGAYPSISVGTEYFVDIDVSDLQGHHRIVLGIGVESPVRNEATVQTNVFVTNSVLGISHIEFIN